MEKQLLRKKRNFMLKATSQRVYCVVIQGCGVGVGRIFNLRSRSRRKF